MRLFHVFLNREIFQSFKRLVWRIDDDYILRMGGVQLKVNNEGKLNIYPVYYPLFTWKTEPGSKELTVYLKNVSYMLIWRNGFSIYKSTDKELRENEEQ